MSATLASPSHSAPAVDLSWREPASVLLADDELDALVDAQVAVFWNGPQVPPTIPSFVPVAGPDVPPDDNDLR